MQPAASATDELDAQTLVVRVRQLESLLTISEARCAKLEYRLQDLLRRVFGPKSEKLNPAQRALFGILESAGLAVSTQPATTSAAASGQTKRKKGGGRRPKPQN